MWGSLRLSGRSPCYQMEDPNVPLSQDESTNQINDIRSNVHLSNGIGKESVRSYMMHQQPSVQRRIGIAIEEEEEELH